MATTTSGASSPDSVEALKRVKATENEWDVKIAAARTERDATLERLRREADDAVREAGAQAERDRATRVDSARAEIAKEADAIVAEGHRAAEEATHGEGRRPADRKEAILSAVLGSFGSE
jgi:vacuolar-type H+-ATPase subunit H